MHHCHHIIVQIVVLSIMFTSALKVFPNRSISNLTKRVKYNHNVRLFSSSVDSNNQLIWPVSKVRKQFIEYFSDTKQHVNYKSSPVVPVNDPTLLFANAGMNQFKPIFLGTVDPTSPLAALSRAVNSWEHGHLEIILKKKQLNGLTIS